jgi:hypothetical protein
MNIKFQCCTRVQASRLRKLGVHFDNYTFCWEHEGAGKWNLCYDGAPLADVVPAFTLAELFLMLGECKVADRGDLNPRTAAKEVADVVILGLENGWLDVVGVNGRLNK